jgi:uncharacterized protein YggE
MNRLILFLSVLIVTGCQSKNDIKTIVLKTDGYVEAAPDEAGIVLNLNCVDKRIENAKSCLIDKTANLNNDLIVSGILKEDILTTGVALAKDYIWVNNSNVFNGYNASTSVNVRVRNLKVLDELYTKLLDNEQLTIGSLTYYHSKIDSLNEVAYLKALDKAGTIADMILTRIPEKNKSIIKISNIEMTEKDDGPVLQYRKFEEAAASDQGTMIVNTGNIKVEQHLFVEFKVY